jgi:hypothetical protein
VFAPGVVPFFRPYPLSRRCSDGRKEGRQYWERRLWSEGLTGGRLAFLTKVTATRLGRARSGFFALLPVLELRLPSKEPQIQSTSLPRLRF